MHRRGRRWMAVATGMAAVAVVVPVRAGVLAAVADVEARVTVELRVVGAEREPGREYAFELRCAHPDGTARPPIALALRKDGARTLRSTDIAGLTGADECVAEATPVEGAQTAYRSTRPARDDGTVPDAVPGVLDGGRYRSAPARAAGTAITVTHTFAGDLVLHSAVSNRLPGTDPLFGFTVRCDPDGSTHAVTLGDGQTQTLTGIPAGSTCRVALPGGTVRYVDNSGDPNDGVVTVLNTPARCWDLRTTDPTCRAAVDATVTMTGAEPDARAAAEQSTSSSTTTSPTTTMAPATTAAPTTAAPATTRAAAATVAPAVEAGAAVAVESEPAFTG